MLMQNKGLFDTAGGNSTDFKYSTDGTAYTYDFDRFELEYAPGQETTLNLCRLP